MNRGERYLVDYVLQNGETLEPRRSCLVGMLYDKRPIQIVFEDTKREGDVGHHGILTVQVTARKRDQYGFEISARIGYVEPGIYIAIKPGMSDSSLPDIALGKLDQDIGSKYCTFFMDYVEKCIQNGEVTFSKGGKR